VAATIERSRRIGPSGWVASSITVPQTRLFARVSPSERNEIGATPAPGPGPPMPLYLAGAKMSAMYITVQSHMDPPCVEPSDAPMLAGDAVMLPAVGGVEGAGLVARLDPDVQGLAVGQTAPLPAGGGIWNSHRAPSGWPVGSGARRARPCVRLLRGRPLPGPAAKARHVRASSSVGRIREAVAPAVRSCCQTVRGRRCPPLPALPHPASR